MPSRIRQWYAAATVAVFVLVAPLLLASAAGYRWAGWHRGFVSTGMIVVYSNPKAALTLNGRPMGPTPKRLTRLLPGTYQLALQADGYGAWNRLVHISAKAAEIVGPVQLFPPRFSVATVRQAADESWLVANDGAAVFSLRPEQAQWQVAMIWPDSPAATYDLPAKPTLAAVSQNRRTLLFILPTSTYIFSADQPQTPWIVPSNVFHSWLSGSETLFFAAAPDGSMARYDTMERTVTPFDRADSVTVSGDTVWLAKSGAQTTRIWRRPALGVGDMKIVEEISGRWEFMSTRGPIIMRNPDTGQTDIYTVSLTDTVTKTSLGLADALLFADNKIPLWQHGSDVMTLDQDGQPLLLLRGPDQWRSARWLDPGHIVLLVSDRSVRVTSVSSRQGRTDLLAYTAASPLQLLSVAPGKRTATVALSNPTAILTLSW